MKNTETSTGQYIGFYRTANQVQGMLQSGRITQDQADEIMAEQLTTPGQIPPSLFKYNKTKQG
jgi:hypothetical protein